MMDSNLKNQINGFFAHKDRRFYHERINDLNNQDIEKLAEGKIFKEITEGSYDTGDGYYQLEKGSIFTYDNKYLREPNEDEDWIKLNCRSRTN